MQEKNRTAQRRFRQRQKQKMVGLEQRVTRLSIDLEKLSTENGSLRHMNRILEKVLTLRDEHITGLQEAVSIFHSHGFGKCPYCGTRQGVNAGSGGVDRGERCVSDGDTISGFNPGVPVVKGEMGELEPLPSQGEGKGGIVKGLTCKGETEAQTNLRHASTDGGGAGLGMAHSCHKDEVVGESAPGTATATTATTPAATTAAPHGNHQRAPRSSNKYTPEYVARMTAHDVMDEWRMHVLAVQSAMARLECQDPDTDALRWGGGGWR